MKLVSGIVLGGLTALSCSAAILPAPNVDTKCVECCSSVKWNTPTQSWSDENSAVCRDILNYKGGVKHSANITIELKDGMENDEYKLDYSGNNYTITASAPRGVYYAVATIRQMMVDLENSYTSGSISDKPLWQHRYVSDIFEKATRENFIDLVANKMSGVTLRAENIWLDPDFKDKYAAQLATIKQMKESDIADVMIQMHLLRKTPFAPVNFSKEEEIVNIIDHCRLFAEQGVDMIMLAVDDLTPRDGANFTFATDDEKKMFRDSAGLGHGYVTKRVAEAMAAEYPDLKIAMVIAPYALDAFWTHLDVIQQYFIDWAEQAPDDVYIVWTGNGIFSPTVTQEDLERIQNFAPNHPVMMFSNSNGHAAYMAMWETEYVDTMREAGDGNIILWGSFFSRPLERIFYLGANAYLWQGAENFDPIKAYYDGAVSEFGKEAAEVLLPLQRAYQNFLTIKSRGNRDDARPAYEAFKTAYDNAVKVKDINGNSLPLSGVKSELDWGNEVMTFDLKSVTISNEPATIKLTERKEGVGEDMPTTMTMAYDGDNVLLTFDVVNPEKTSQEQLPHDSEIFFNDDVIEIFFQPAPLSYEWIYSEVQNNALVHFCFDSAGNKFDERGPSGGFSYDPAWDLKVEETSTGWKAYVSIPVESFNAPRIKYVEPADGVLWKGNFHRVNNQAGFVQSWGTTGTSFHMSQYFGEINFSDK